MRILIAEDEPFVASSIASSLQAVGYIVDVVHDGEEAWFRGSTENYAAVILDLGLPKLDGISILKRWRSEGIQTPVLVVSARGTWAERVDGIDSGADDYLPKPYQMQEVVARLRALLRRAGGHSQSILTAGKVEVDLKSRIVSVGGAMIQLTPLEFRLVHHLVNSKDRVVSQVELADALYEHDHDRDANAIEALISRLRRKLGAGVIENKRGFGYRIANLTP
ncbi:MAG: response regulator transcription factor [Aestuariivirga sp.]